MAATDHRVMPSSKPPGLQNQLHVGNCDKTATLGVS